MKKRIGCRLHWQKVVAAHQASVPPFMLRGLLLMPWGHCGGMAHARPGCQKDCPPCYFRSPQSQILMLMMNINGSCSIFIIFLTSLLKKIRELLLVCHDFVILLCKSWNWNDHVWKASLCINGYVQFSQCKCVLFLLFLMERFCSYVGCLTFVLWKMQ